MAARVTPTVAVQISANLVKFTSTLEKASYDLKNFGNQINKIGGVVGLAFGTAEVLRFGFEVSKLAGGAEAVRDAFNKLPGSVALMNDLRNATGQTVSQLDLMKTAIKASNFQIDLAKLPKLLEFATLRAQQTGQSIDYLVESIVMGIGRKSPMILDNLGISLIRLREKLKGVGTEAASIGQYTQVVSDIIDEDLGKMAAFSENTKTKTERLTGAWGDLKVAIGDAANSTGILGNLIDSITASLTILASTDISWADKLAAFANPAAMPVVLAKAYAAGQKLSEESKRAVTDAKKIFDQLSKDTKEYDIIRQKAQEKMNVRVEQFKKAQQEVNLGLDSQSKKTEINNKLIKLSTTYQRDFKNQIEASIEAAKPVPIDPEELKKQLEKAEKEWDKYYKKITAGAEIAAMSILLSEKLAVGLGKPKEGKPLLAIPGFDKDEKVKNQNFAKLMLGWIDSPAFKDMITKMDEAQTKARNMQATFAKMGEVINQSFEMIAVEGMASFSLGLGQLISDKEAYKDFGKNILRMLAELIAYQIGP